MYMQIYVHKLGNIGSMSVLLLLVVICNKLRYYYYCNCFNFLLLPREDDPGVLGEARDKEVGVLLACGLGVHARYHRCGH